MWQTFPGHFLKKYEKYLRKDLKQSPTSAPGPMVKFNDRFVDNKETQGTLDDKDAVRVTHEKIKTNGKNLRKKLKTKVTEPPPRGLTALASFPVSFFSILFLLLTFCEKRVVAGRIIEDYFVEIWPEAFVGVLEYNVGGIFESMFSLAEVGRVQGLILVDFHLNHSE